MPVPEDSGGVREGEMASIKDTHYGQDGVMTAAVFTGGHGISQGETREEI